MSLRALALAAVSSAALLTATAAQANLVINGSFESATLGPNNKNSFQGNVTGWSGGSNLTFIDGPGTADGGVYLAVYGPFPKTSPDGGNFVEADGDPTYSSTFSQTLSGLTANKAYSVSFYQAAGQQAGFSGPTTEQWKVSLGANSQLSSLFSLPQGGVGPWQKQTLTFIAAASSQVLSFLAVGTPGGAPPISFLDGVDVEAASVPEPASFALLGLGLVAVQFARRAVKKAA